EKSEKSTLLFVLRVVDVVDEYRNASGSLAVAFSEQRHHLRVIEKRMPPPAEQQTLLRENRRDPVRIVLVDRPREPLKTAPVAPRRHRSDGDTGGHRIHRADCNRFTHWRPPPAI